MVDRQQLYPKLEELGPAEVRRRLDDGKFGERKIPAIKEWLSSHEISKTQQRHDERLERMDTSNEIAKSARNWSRFAVGASAIALALHAIVNWDKIKSIF